MSGKRKGTDPNAELASGSGVDASLVMISINGQAAMPMGRTGCMDALSAAMDHHQKMSGLATRITVNITTVTPSVPPTTDHPANKKHRANSKSPPIATADSASGAGDTDSPSSFYRDGGSEPNDVEGIAGTPPYTPAVAATVRALPNPAKNVPCKPESAEDGAGDAEVTDVGMDEATSYRGHWVGPSVFYEATAYRTRCGEPSMPLKALATAASTALKAETKAEAKAEALAVAVDESCMASPRTGSAPPSEAKVKFERYTPDGGGSIKKQRALPPQKRYQRFSEQEWKTNIIGAVEAGFGRFKAVGDKRHTIGIIDSVLARVVGGTGKAEAIVLARAGVQKKACFLIQRKKVGSKAPFHVKVSGTRMVAQKAAFAAYNALEAHEIGTWQVEQSCRHNTTDWWCFEPSHLQRCVKDHVRPGSTKCAIPGDPHALLTS